MTLRQLLALGPAWWQHIEQDARMAQATWRFTVATVVALSLQLKPPSGQQLSHGKVMDAVEWWGGRLGGEIRRRAHTFRPAQQPKVVNSRNRAQIKLPAQPVGGRFFISEEVARFAHII